MSRVESSFFALLPILNCPVKLEVIFCVQAVISPLLANLYLHYVLDRWVIQWRKKYAFGDVLMVRYADDCAPRAQRGPKGPRSFGAREK